MFITAIILFLLFFASQAHKSLERGILLVVALLPLYLVRFSFGPLPMTLLEGMILILSVMWVVKGGLSRAQEVITITIKKIPFFWAGVGVFLTASVISIFVAPDLRAALGIWRAYFAEPFLFFLICITTLRTHEQLKRVLWASVAMVVPIALYALIQKFTGYGIPHPWDVERRATSVYPYPNGVGLYLAPLIAFAVGLAVLSKSWIKKISALAVAGFAALGIYSAKTEAAYVAMTVTAALSGLVWSRRARRMVLLCCAIGIAVLVFVSPIRAVVNEKIFLHDWSGRVRMITWNESVAMLSDRWLTGAGLSGYQTAMRPYHKATFIEIFLYPHSFLLNFWTEMGLLGVIGILAILFSAAVLCIQLVRRKGEYRTLGLILLATLGIICIHGLVDVPYFKNDLSVFFWMVLAMIFISSQFTGETEKTT